jgi:hypothetical protein
MDYETRYGTALERIAQLEEDLVEKAIMAEEVQRLKDEVKGIERIAHTRRVESETNHISMLQINVKNYQCYQPRSRLCNQLLL